MFKIESMNNIMIFGLDINWSIFVSLPEMYLLFMSVVGLIWVNTFNFEPKAAQEKIWWIMPGMLQFSVNSLWMTGIILMTQSTYFFEKVIVIFHGYSINDAYTWVIKCSVVLTVILITLLNTNRLIAHINPQRETPVLILLLTTCLLILISAYNFMTVFLGIIGFSLTIYVLILGDGFKRSAREAGVKYFYLSTTSSGLLLCGIFLSYLIFHSTSFMSINWLIHNWLVFNTLEEKNLLLTIQLYFIIFGFLFKLAAFPGHLWAPEVYNGSPNLVMALFVLPIKMATLALFVRILTHAFGDLYVQWFNILWISSFFSMFWGCFGALVEQNIKKFVAYSSINQMGFLLMGLTSGTTEGVQATLFYLLLYVVMNSGFFIIFLTTQRNEPTLNKFPVQTVGTFQSIRYITDFNVFAKTNYLQSIGLIVILFSMAGIPPLGGFFGKYFLFLHSFETGNIGLVILGMLTSVVAAYYYLRIVKILWFEKRRNFLSNKLNYTYLSDLSKPNSILFKIYIFIEFFLIWFLIWCPLIFLILEKITTMAIHPISHSEIILDTTSIGNFCDKSIVSLENK